MHKLIPILALVILSGCFTTKMKSEWAEYETIDGERVVKKEGKCKAPGQWCIQEQAIRSGLFDKEEPESAEPVVAVDPCASLKAPPAGLTSDTAQAIWAMGSMLCPIFASMNGGSADVKDVVQSLAYELGPKPKTDFAAMQRATLAATQSDNAAKEAGYRSMGAVAMGLGPPAIGALAGSALYGGGDSFGDVTVNNSTTGRSGTRVNQTGPSADGGSGGGGDEGGGAGSGGDAGNPLSAHQEGMVPFTGGGDTIISIGGHNNSNVSATSAGSLGVGTNRGQAAQGSGQNAQDRGATAPLAPIEGDRSGVLPALF